MCLWFSHTLEKKSTFLGLHQNLYISHKLINEMSEDGSIFPHKRQKLGASKYILQKKRRWKNLINVCSVNKHPAVLIPYDT